MSQPDRDTLESVEKLLAERRKVSGWLSALDARRADTSEAVYQRVADDYTAKLDKVQAKLVAASDAVNTLAADVASRLTDKELVLSTKRDERAEAELRAAVGEYSEKEWDKRRSRLDDEITAAAGERDALRDELARLRSVLNEVAGAAVEEPGSAREETPVPAPALAAVGEPVPIESLLTADPASADEPAETGDTPGESVQVAAVEPPAIEIHEQSIIAAVEPAMPLAPSFDELAFLKTVVGRPTPMAAPRVSSATSVPGDAATEPSAAAESPAQYAVPEPPLHFPDPVPEPRVSQEMTPPRESFFGRPTPRSSEAVKSLKCAECGTLNFPTEWYCERCGGELAAL